MKNAYTLRVVNALFSYHQKFGTSHLDSKFKYKKKALNINLKNKSQGLNEKTKKELKFPFIWGDPESC